MNPELVRAKDALVGPLHLINALYVRHMGENCFIFSVRGQPLDAKDLSQK